MAAGYESKAPGRVPTKPPEKCFTRKEKIKQKREEDCALIFGLKVQTQITTFKSKQMLIQYY